MTSQSRESLTDFGKKYLSLRNSVDKQCAALIKVHKQNMKCARGCSSCCMDFSIFPVEYNYIRESIKESTPNVNTSVSEGQCPFLIENACSVYEHRPVICRTHGLPLLSMGDEEWELNHCELNFTDGETVFTTGNCLITDKINSRLFMLNREYLKQEGIKQHTEFDLLPLSSLAKVLLKKGSD